MQGAQRAEARELAARRERAAQAVALAGDVAEARQLFASPPQTGQLDLFPDQRRATRDSFQNFELALGLGTNNALSGSTYGFNPITRNRTLLEWMHRGSWLAGQAIDIVGADMTRGGIEVTSKIKQADRDRLHAAATTMALWPAIGDCTNWSRLYGGALSVMLIDGQDPSTRAAHRQRRARPVQGPADARPLDGRTVVRQTSSASSARSSACPGSTGPRRSRRALRMQNIHHSRVLRMEGIRLPYHQRLTENLLGPVGPRAALRPHGVVRLRDDGRRAARLQVVPADLPHQRAAEEHRGQRRPGEQARPIRRADAQVPGDRGRHAPRPRRRVRGHPEHGVYRHQRRA